jgi:hypothetical protein
MNRNLRWTFACTFAFFLCLAIPQAARAQMACLDCDPYNSSCSEECWYCQTPHINNECPQYEVEYSTCGDYLGACIQDNCTSNWQETNRVTQGTYGNGSMFSCSHHRVDWVTETDSNQCNLSSYFWTRHYCDDDVDGGKSGWFPDCCDGYGPGGVPDATYTCNDYHSCTG